MWKIGKDTGLVIGTLMEWIGWLTRRSPKLTTLQVKYACLTRYYDIGKAKKRLGYAPIVGLQEGIDSAVRWFEEQSSTDEKNLKELVGQEKLAKGMEKVVEITGQEDGLVVTLKKDAI